MGPKAYGKFANDVKSETIICQDAVKPKRETVICQDEIVNLKICLNTTKDVNDFIKRI
jgi:hypothetical protein